MIKDKLIATKEKWAREGRLLTGAAPAASPTANRLPPGQRLTRDFPVLDLGERPAIATKDWKLKIDGLVERPVLLDWAAFQQLPQTDITCDIHCVTAWSRYDNIFSGVMARQLLAMVRPTSEARHVLFHSYDGYTTNVTLGMLSDPDVMIAHSWNGQPLTREHGGPVRVVMPRYYLWKSAKWLKRIEFLKDKKYGFWENRGYHETGNPWREQRYG